MNSLATVEGSLTAILENVPELIVMVDPDLALLYANPACRKFIAQGIEERSGSFLSFVHPEDRALVRRTVELVLTRGDTRTLSFRGLQHEEKHWRWLEGSINPPTPGSSNPGAIAILRDVTVEKRAELERNAGLHLAQLLARTEHWESAVDQVLQTVCLGFNFSCGFFWRGPAKPGGELTCAGAYSGAERGLVQFAALSKVHSFAPGISHVGECWAEQKTVFLGSLREQARFRRLQHALECGLEMVVAVPIGRPSFGGVLEFFGGGSDRNALENKGFKDAISQLNHFLRKEELQNQLAAERELLNSLLENIPSRWYYKDEQLRYAHASRAFLEFHQVPHLALLKGKTDFDLYPKERAQELAEEELEILRGTKSVVQRNATDTNRQGITSWCVVSRKPLRDKFGKVIGTFGLSTDVSELTRAKAAVEISEEFLNSVLETLPVNIFRKNRQGQYTFLNARFANTLQKPIDEIIGKTDHDLYRTDFAEKFLADDERVISEQTISEQVVEYPSAEGHERRIHLIKVPLFNLNGEVVGVQGTFWDITERWQAEQETQRVHRETEEVLSSLSAILIGVDTQGKIFRWNKAAEESFGIVAHKVIGRHFWDCGIHWNWPQVRQAVHEAMGRNASVELRDLDYRAADNSDGFLDVVIMPGTSGSSVRLQYLILARDITQRQLLETHVQQAQKLESIGQLAAGIAHEINTPVQFIGDNLRFIAETLKELQASGSSIATEPGHQLPEAVHHCLEGVDRISRIVGAMKDFSFHDRGPAEPADLNRGIESTITISKNEWKYLADIDLALAPELPPVCCYIGEINQVVLNMIVNAAHAIAELPPSARKAKGRIQIATRMLDENWVEIAVSDNGVGIPDWARAKIFDPFFTTKPVGKGTGQGLFLAHKTIVEKHQGRILVETERNVGTTFRIQIPLRPGLG
jgi:PAS domain S-box-containing protein